VNDEGLDHIQALRGTHSEFFCRQLRREAVRLEEDAALMFGTDRGR
jgi:hypothetical protein